jgi:hypothetical protein
MVDYNNLMTGDWIQWIREEHIEGQEIEKEPVMVLCSFDKYIEVMRLNGHILRFYSEDEYDTVREESNAYCWVELFYKEMSEEYLVACGLEKETVNGLTKYVYSKQVQLAGEGFEYQTVTYHVNIGMLCVQSATCNIIMPIKSIHEFQHILKLCSINIQQRR